MYSFLKEFISYNHNFGINVSLSPNFPNKYLSPLGKLNIIISENGNILESSEISQGQSIRFPFSCYQEVDIQLFSYLEGVLVEIWKSNFTLNNKYVVVDLQPHNKDEFDIWVEYLKWFQNKTSCNLHLIHKNYNQDFFPPPNGEEAFASYVIYWNPDQWANPLGVDVNPYDLINNALFRI